MSKMLDYIFSDQCLIAVAQIYNNLGIAYTEDGDLEAADEAFG
jgi:lipoprotein NlpI